MPAENKKRTVPRHRSFLCVSAESREIDQLDGGGNISFSRRLWLRIIGGKVFFVVVRKHGNHRCTAAELFLQQRGAEKVCPGGNADAQAELPGKMLCHPDGVAVVHRNDVIQFTELDDWGDKFVRNAVNAVSLFLRKI